MSDVARNLVVKIGADLTGLQKGLKQSAKEFKTAGKEMSSAGTSLTKGLTVPILGAVVGLAGLAINAGNTADELLTLSQQTGLSTQRLQELQYASRFVDVEVETLTKSMAKNIKSMKAAQDGTKLSVDAYKQLGVEVLNADGSMRDGQAVYWDVIDALGKMTNETERDALGMQLLGKSAQELNPLIKAGSAELKRLSEEAHTVGAVMDDETVVALGKFDDQMEKLEAVVKTAGAKIGAAFVPVLMKLQPVIVNKIVPAVQSFAGTITKLIDGFDDLSPAVKTIVGGVVGFAVAIGPALTIMGKLSLGVSGLMTSLSAATKVLASGGGFTAALGTLIGPAGIAVLAIAAVAGVVLAISALTKESREATKAANEAVKTMVESWQSSAQAAQKSIDDVENNSVVTQKLADDLFDLADKEKKTSAEKSKMVELVAQLNQLMPELSLTIDAQTGKLNLQREAVYKLIAAKKTELQLASYEQALMDLYKKLPEQTDAVTAAAIRYRKAQAAIDEEIKSGKKPRADLRQELYGAAEAYNSVVGAQDETKKSIETLEAAYDGIVKSVTETTGSIEEEYKIVTAAGIEFTRDQKKQAEEQIALDQKTAEEAAAALAQQLEDRKAYNKEIESAAQSNMETMGGIEDEGITKTKLTAAQMKKNLDKQVADFEDWRKGIKTLAARVPEDVMIELRALGPGIDPIIDEMNNMSDAKLAEYVETFRSKAAAARGAAIQELSGLPAAVRTIGGAIGVGLAAGIDSSLWGVRAAAQRLANAAKVLSPNWSLVFGPGSMPHYASGTDYVPRTGPAIIHQGEAVLTKEENARRNSGAKVTQAPDSDIVVNVYLDDVFNTSQKIAKRKNTRSGRVTIPLGV